MAQRIVLVGHCGVDAPRLEAAVTRYLPRAEVIMVNSEQQLDEVVDEGADLLLINRQLPFGFDEEEGIELMRELKQAHPAVKLMLVSDRSEAQTRAESVGGELGFGKSDLGTKRAAEVLRKALRSAPVH